MEQVLLISDAAKKVNVEAHVLRYWEEELGLPIKRNELGHRYYTEEDVKRFQEVKSLKEHGLQLKAIRLIMKKGQVDFLEPVEKANAVSETKVNGTDSPSEVLQGEKILSFTREETPLVQEQMQDDISSYYEPDKVETSLQEESKENKMLRLQWLLKQLFRETLMENNDLLCTALRENFIKEMDYQFRMMEEREDERYQDKVKRDEEYYKRIDELLRKKRGGIKKDKDK